MKTAETNAAASRTPMPEWTGRGPDERSFPDAGLDFSNIFADLATPSAGAPVPPGGVDSQDGASLTSLVQAQGADPKGVDPKDADATGNGFAATGQSLDALLARWAPDATDPKAESKPSSEPRMAAPDPEADPAGRDAPTVADEPSPARLLPAPDTLNAPDEAAPPREPKASRKEASERPPAPSAEAESPQPASPVTPPILPAPLASPPDEERHAMPAQAAKAQSPTPQALPPAPTAGTSPAEPAEDDWDSALDVAAQLDAAPADLPSDDALERAPVVVTVLNRETHFAPVRSFSAQPLAEPAIDGDVSGNAAQSPEGGEAARRTPGVAPAAREDGARRPAPARELDLPQTAPIAASPSSSPAATPGLPFASLEQVGRAIAEEAAQMDAAAAPAGTSPDLPSDNAARGPVRILEMALTPESLGRVVVRLRLTPSGLDVRVAAADPATAQLLEQDRDILMRLIEARDVKVRDLAIDAAPRPSDFAIADPLPRLPTAPRGAAVPSEDATSRRDADRNAGGDEPGRRPHQEPADDDASAS